MIPEMVDDEHHQAYEHEPQHEPTPTDVKHPRFLILKLLA